MSDAKKAWGSLLESVGEYSGQGVNHEKLNYKNQFSLKQDFEGKSLSLSSTATGEQGQLFHSERSFIGFDITGSLVLYVISNNHPTITPHIFNRIEIGLDGEKKIIFRFGNIEDKNSFREEVSITIFKDNSIEHFYSWGLPGGNFEPRSGARVYRK
jgi:hypothetical protein